jgi:signal transduction histidine kinase/CheY-like chemotaxis protein
MTSSALMQESRAVRPEPRPVVAGWPRNDQIELMPRAVCVCDTKGAIVAYNNKATALWGTMQPPNGSGLYGGFVHLFRPDGTRLSPDRSPVAWVLASGESMPDVEFVAERKNGTRATVLFDIAPLVDRQGGVTGAIIALQDITDMRRCADARYQLMLLDALRRFAGEVAHDFCNSLAVLSHNLETVKRQCGSPATDKFITNASQSAQRAQELASQLFEFAQTACIAREESDVNALITAVCKAIPSDGRAKQLLELHLAENLWPTRVDGILLERSIQHLAANARDAMPDGGTTIIRTANVELKAGNGYLAPGKYVMISVIDTGHGMSDELQAEAFEPMFTTKSGGANAGLGLSIVLGMARQHGGDAQILSQIGQGTQINLYFPCDPTFPNAAHEITVLAPQMERRSANILIVDDDADFRTAVVDAFGNLGLDVLDADSGLGALAILRSSRPLDLLVVDYNIGRMDGLELLQRAQMLRPGIKALMITGRTKLPEARLRVAGNVTVLNKPFGIAEFMQRVKCLVPNLLPDGF